VDVTSKIRDDLKSAITVCLDAYAQDKKIDERLVEAVADVIAKIEAPKIEKEFKAIRYKGRPATYTDSLYGTGAWNQGQTKLVPVSVAQQMLSHPDVYEEGGEPVGYKVKPQETPKEPEIDRIEDVRIEVQNMTRKKAVAEWVQDNYQMDIGLDQTDSLANHKAKALMLLDQYGIP
jgi:hypothetical protein